MNSRNYNATIEEPVAGNYYPIVNEIFIEDDYQRIAVLTDRAEGGASLQEGLIEIMVHRRLLHDDAFGVGEALNETANDVGLTVRGKHRLINVQPNEEIFEKKLVIQTHLSPIVFVSNADKVSYEEWMKLNNCFKGLKELPIGVHLLTLEPLGANTLLLRVENYLKKSENSTVLVDFGTIFNNLKILSLRETSLAANRWLDDIEKWRWNTENVFKSSLNEEYGNFNNNNGDRNEKDVKNEGNFEIKEEGLKINLKAKQIRTFIANYEMII